MNSKAVVRTVVIISLALLAAGCQLINPQPPKATPTPKPSGTPSVSTPLPTFEPLPTATPSATPKATTGATTKGGQPVSTGAVKGAATRSVTSTTSRVSPLYDTSFDTWEITNFPGQEYETELKLYNKSNSRVLYSIRAADRYSDTVPVSVNGSYEATGDILPQATTTVKLKAYSSDRTPSFNTTLTLNFVSLDNQILSTRTIKVTAHTPLGDKTTLESNTDANPTGNAVMTVTYSPNKAFPIHLVNLHSYTVNWTAKFQTSESDNRLVVSAKSGQIPANGFWDTDIHFTNTDIGPMTQAILLVTFSRDNGGPSETKTLTVNVNR